MSHVKLCDGADGISCKRRCPYQEPTTHPACLTGSRVIPKFGLKKWMNYLDEIVEPITSVRIMKTLQQFPLEWSKIPRISLECMSLASIVFAWMPLRIMNQCMRASFLTLRESLPIWCPNTSILANSHNFTTKSCKAPWLPQKKKKNEWRQYLQGLISMLQLQFYYNIYIYEYLESRCRTSFNPEMWGLKIKGICS